MNMLSGYAKMVEKYFGKDGKEKPNKNPRMLISKVLDDGTLIETVYIPETKETCFAVFKDGTIEYQQSVEIDGDIYKPISAYKDIITCKVVLFPSKAEEYDSFKSLVTKIRNFVHKYLEISEFYERLVSYYIAFTWIYDKFNELPYLRAIGDYGCGKSRFLQTIGSLCYKPMIVGGASTVSPIFRIIADYQGTLILDEADYAVSDTTAEIVKILNQGFSKGIPILRTESIGKKFEIVAFQVFGPKIISTREHWKDTALESRCLIERMEGKSRDDIPINLTNDFWTEALNLRNKLLMFRFNNFHKEVDFRNLADKSIEPRLNQIVVPLLSIIEDIDDRNELKRFMKDYNKDLLQERYSSFEAEIVTTILKIIESSSEPTMKEIAELHNQDFSLKYPMTAKSIGTIVRKKLKIPTKKTSRGYIIPTLAKERLEKLKQKFGIDSENEHVNLMNISDLNGKDINNAPNTLVQHAEGLFGVKAEPVIDETLPPI